MGLDSIDLDTMRHVLGRFSGVALAYLFGSRVRGPVGPMSDYDFGVLLDDGEDLPSLRARLAHELAIALETPEVDVVVLNRAAVDLAHAIIAQGMLICQRDRLTRVEYESRVMGLYGDYLPVLRAQRCDILRGEGYDARVQRYRAAFAATERTLGAIRAAKGERPGCI